MLRDIPKVYVMMFFFIAVTSLLTVWYLNSFQRGTDTLQLNEVVLSSAVSEVDPTSRIYEGTLLLADTFEESVWDRLQGKYPEGSIVQFDYLFDTEDSRFDNIESETVSSVPYRLGGTDDEIPLADNEEQVSRYTGRPIKIIRVKVKEPEDKVGEWTYTATITVDAASKAKD